MAGCADPFCWVDTARSGRAGSGLQPAMADQAAQLRRDDLYGGENAPSEIRSTEARRIVQATSSHEAATMIDIGDYVRVRTGLCKRTSWP